MNDIIMLIILGVTMFTLGALSTINDTKLNNTWDKCQERFEQSGAPMEARDNMMRDCFSK